LGRKNRAKAARFSFLFLSVWRLLGPLHQPSERKAAVPRSRTKTSLDAIDMLKQDHDKVDKAFKEFEKMDRQDIESCRQVIKTVCEELKVHTTLEEEIFYPAVRGAIEDEDLMNEAAVEHETAKMLIDQLENMGPDDPNYFATFTVLGEYVRHHIKEEQGEMFPAAKKAKLDLDGLAERMRARKEELAGEAQRTPA
jgi:hemerythrin superfamily protein